MKQNIWSLTMVHDPSGWNTVKIILFTDLNFLAKFSKYHNLQITSLAYSWHAISAIFQKMLNWFSNFMHHFAALPES